MRLQFREKETAMAAQHFSIRITTEDVSILGSGSIQTYSLGMEYANSSCQLIKKNNNKRCKHLAQKPEYGPKLYGSLDRRKMIYDIKI